MSAFPFFDCLRYNGAKKKEGFETMQAIWIRNDLRLKDNTALIHALKIAEREQEPLLLFFYIDPLQLAPETRSHDYFFAALADFYASCQSKNLPLYLITGPLDQAFATLFDQFPTIKGIHYNVSHRGYGLKRDRKVADMLRDKGTIFKGYSDHHLHAAHEILTKDDTPYKVYTPYYNQWKLRTKRQPLSLDLAALQRHVIQDISVKNQDGETLFQTLCRQIQGNYADWLGEDNAQERLRLFCVEKMHRYHLDKDFPSIDGTSRLSSYLSTGQLSIRDVFLQVSRAPDSQGKENFIKELAWRDFYQMVYAFHPQQKELEVMEKYQGIPWQSNDEWFTKWQAGQTGFPIVDAAMRQLQTEGWMHNRLRMIAASFLTKDLNIDWRLGEAYFSQQLIDYDSASNIGGWQWSASVGTDAVPYFRIFNPTLQSQKFDPSGTFIRQYVPELRDVPDYAIHEPYHFEQKLRTKEGIELKRLYPPPIVDHKHQRLQSIEKYKYYEKNRRKEEARCDRQS